jgi:hypothetical protein
MSFRSRIEHFEVQKMLQGVQLPPKKILGTCGAPFTMLNAVRTMQLKGLTAVFHSRVVKSLSFA